MPPMLALDDWIGSTPDTDHPDSGAHEVHAEPGTIIGGSYRVQSRLGTGSMGQVLLAYDETLDRHVAIKFAHRSLLSKSFRDRFLQEARAMARVSHPNVLQVHAFGEHNGEPYFVMQYVQGPTLEQWLTTSQAGGPPDLDLTLRIFDDLCRGVSAIHDAETVHYDIKPSNILLDEDLKPLVADLGLAVFYRQEGTRQREIIGTPAYMAPEIAFSREIDPELRARADVYSLACVAYQLFTCRLPFDGSAGVRTLLEHAMRPVVPPSRLRAGLPAGVDRAMLRALAKDPRERTSSVELFRSELSAARPSEDEPVRILVAEDDDDFRQALGLFLTLQFPNAEIECVSDGAGALEAVDRLAPSVAILDLRMPEIDGMELTRRLRERHSSRSMPIIIVTACGGSEEWTRLAALGADRFLVKPVVLDDLEVLVRRVLRGRADPPSSPIKC